jgi:hypothetical protein
MAYNSKMNAYCSAINVGTTTIKTITRSHAVDFILQPRIMNNYKINIGCTIY